MSFSRVLLTAAAIGLAIAPVTVSAQDAPIILSEPTGKWIVDYGETRCLAYRSYETVLGPTTLHFKPSLFTDRMDVLITYGREGRPQEPNGRLTLQWNEISFPKGEVHWGLYALKGDSRLLELSLPLDEFNNSDSVASMAFKFADSPDFGFVIPQWQAARKAMRICSEDLRLSLGIEKDALEAIVEPAEGKGVHDLFSTEDYPSEAVFKSWSGTVRPLFWIETDGKVKQCSILESSGHPILDSKTCTVIKQRARFKPARNAAGEPVREPRSTSIRWIIP